MTGNTEQKAVHGGRGRYINKTCSELLDFSASINPYPPILDLSIPHDAVIQYPDDEYQILKKTIADYHHCSPENITVGNGSVEVIRTLCHTLLSPGKSAYIPKHTFAEYAMSVKLTGAHVNTTEEEADIIFLCNPDNPSGLLLSKEEVLKRIPDQKGRPRLLCVDEAFIDLADPNESVAGLIQTGLFVLRSLTKSFAVPGIRFGYGIGTPDLIAAMEVMRPPWTVNALAESVVLQAFSKYPDLAHSRKMISDERKRLIPAIEDHGWRCMKGTANYLLIDTGGNASEIASKFAEYTIIVRDCTSFDLPAHIRIAIRTPEENNRLLAALENIT